MTPREAVAFRAIYAEWPTSRLARASTLERQDYQPEAVVLMLEELEKRGLSEENLSAVVASTPPPLIGSLPERDTWLFPARLGRRSYLIRAFVLFVAVVAAAVGMEMIPFLEPAGFVILVIASIAYAGVGLLLPRSKDAGFSPGFLAILFFLIPITGFFVFGGLLFVPSKK